MDNLKKDELIALAEEKGVELKEDMLKDEIKDAIRKFDAANEEDVATEESTGAEEAPEDVVTEEEGTEETAEAVEDAVEEAPEEVEEASLDPIDDPKMNIQGIVKYLHEHNDRGTVLDAVEHFKSIRLKLNELIDRYGNEFV